jgi:tRNA(fMet)-specific endonuclease VapC
MNLLLDTNILMYGVRTARQKDFFSWINPDNAIFYLSIVTVAEVKSIAIQNKWSSKKMLILDYIINKCQVIDVSDYLLSSYIEIDTYSQRKNPNFTDYPFATHRNMGKNDLWIASTAAFLGLALVTTDLDFYHLHDVFLEIRQIDTSEIRRYF